MGARAAPTALCALALLCALGLGQRCGPGRSERGTGTDTRCCLPLGCPSRSPAQDSDDAEDSGACFCLQPEFHCADRQCSSCQHHRCPPGQGARPHGQFKFGFNCEDCAPGTFSPGQEGRCRPWADCSQFGFSAVFPGNRTHNAVCSLGRPPAAPAGPLALATLALAACVLALTAVQLSLLLCWLRRPQSPGQWCPGPSGEASLGLAEDGSPPVGARLPTEDACSCQFPEEERGEPLLEDKARLGDLWV